MPLRANLHPLCIDYESNHISHLFCGRSEHTFRVTFVVMIPKCYCISLQQTSDVLLLSFVKMSFQSICVSCNYAAKLYLIVLFCSLFTIPIDKSTSVDKN